MPTPRTPRTAGSASPFDLLSRLNMSGVSSQSQGAGVSEPLLPRSYRPASSSCPGSPSPSSRGGSLPVRSGSPTPTSPASTTSFPPFVSPPRAARLGASRRWIALIAVALVLGVVLSARQGSEDGYATSVREGWRTGVESVKSWTSSRWQASGDGGTAALDAVGAGDSPPPPPPDALEEFEEAGRVGEVGAVEQFGAVDAEPAQDAEAPSTTGEGVQADAAKPPLVPNPSTLDVESDTTAASPPAINVNPIPRPPPRDTAAASKMRFLSFENHSGFHNQRKSLVNALTLAHFLNRTLLLPPARLGAAVPWELDPKRRVAFSERCKAGLEPDKPIATAPNAHALSTGEQCEDPAKWTYTGWDWLVSPSLLAGRSLVDRWNASSEWLTAPLDEGGLGLHEDEIHRFDDRERRSYQILDAVETPMDKGLFTSRIELDVLRDEAGLGGKRLLRFGSLFSGARLKLVKKENHEVLVDTTNKVVLQSDGLDAISDKIRDQLGSYVAAHARVGDGIFKRDAIKNMQLVFRQLTHDVLGLKRGQIDVLLAEAIGATSPKAAAPKKGKGAVANGRKKEPRSFGSLPLSLAERAGAVEPWDDLDEEEKEIEAGLEAERAAAAPLTFPTPSAGLDRRALKGGPSRPLASSLHCRRPLHDAKAAPHLAPLNVPLYIATDSRSPTTDVALAPFTRWFPCVFFLSDFAEAGVVNTEPVPELVELVAAKNVEEGGEGGQWISDWDGQAMAKFLYPFLEAEIAARAVEVVGTPKSTFSGYVRGILHDAYVERGLTAGWNHNA